MKDYLPTPAEVISEVLSQLSASGLVTLVLGGRADKLPLQREALSMCLAKVVTACEKAHEIVGTLTADPATGRVVIQHDGHEELPRGETLVLVRLRGTSIDDGSRLTAK